MKTTAKQFIINTYGESWLRADWTAGDVLDVIDMLMKERQIEKPKGE